jgi:multidrug resistance efflux pump
MPEPTTEIANSAAPAAVGPYRPATGPAAVPSRRAWRRFIRAGLGLTCLGFAAWAVVPLPGVGSDRAVVNAPLATIRSPIDGTVKLVPPPAGTSAPGGEGEVIEVAAYLGHDSRLEALRGEAAALKARTEAAREQLQALDNLSAELEAAARRYQTLAQRRLERRRDAARSAAEQARLTHKQREGEHTLVAGIVGTGGVSRQEVMSSRLVAEAARQAADHEAHVLAGIEEELQALKQGVFLGEGDGRADLPYSAQRRHEVALRRADVQTALRHDEARLAAAEAQARDEEARAARRGQFRAAPAGIVWRHHVADGSAVSAGGALVDCLDLSAVFIDAVVPEKYLAWLRPGDEAVVHLAGTGAAVPAVVKRVARRDLPWAESMLAAEPPSAGRQEVHVLLVPAGDPPAALGADCVGRSAEVTFRRDWRDVLSQYFGVARP